MHDFFLRLKHLFYFGLILILFTKPVNASTNEQVSIKCIEALSTYSHWKQDIDSSVQKNLHQFFSTNRADKHFIVFPNYDPEVLGVRSLDSEFYEMRSLWAIENAFTGHAKVTFVTTAKVTQNLINYYANLSLANSLQWQTKVEFFHVERTKGSLGESLMDQPERLDDLKRTLSKSENTILLPFRSDVMENQLSQELGIPIFGPTEGLHRFTSKSGNKKIFQKAGVVSAPSVENLHSRSEIASAINSLSHDQKAQYGGALTVILKLNCPVPRNLTGSGWGTSHII